LFNCKQVTNSNPRPFWKLVTKFKPLESVEKLNSLDLWFLYPVFYCNYRLNWILQHNFHTIWSLQQARMIYENELAFLYSNSGRISRLLLPFMSWPHLPIMLSTSPLYNKIHSILKRFLISRRVLLTLTIKLTVVRCAKIDF